MYIIECITGGTAYPLLNLKNPDHIVADPKLTMGVNRTGTLEFTVYPNHPHRDRINVMTSRIKVYWVRNGTKTWVYTGRPVTHQKDFYLTGHLVCEGAMSYLLDTRVRPYTYSGTVSGYISYLIANHNSDARSGEEITIRSVDVTDSNDYITRASSGYPTTLDELMDKGPALLGGYMRVVEVNGVLNFDYLTTLPHNSQEIRFGKNLLDLVSKETGESLFTALIPLGADDTEQEQEDGVNNRLKIKYYCPSSQPSDWATRYTDYCTLENDEYIFVTDATAPTWEADTYYYGYDYVYDPDLVSEYGMIIGLQEWDDVTLQSNLFAKATAVIEDQAVKKQVTVTALDLALTDDEVSSFRPGMVTVCSKPHMGGSSEMMLSELTVYLLDPLNSTFTIGTESKTYTSGSTEKLTTIEQSIERSRSYMDDLREEIEAAEGLYSTTVTQEDGSVIMYWHDEPELNDSDMIMQVSTAGVHLTSNGGSSWYGISFNGTTILNMIYAIGLDADYVTTGRIQDATGNNYWDLDTGDFSMLGIATENYADSAASSAAAAAVDNYDDTLTQAEIFNRLTNNGSVQGLIMSGGQLYINASYISSGVLDADLLTTGRIQDQTSNNYWDLDTGDFSMTGIATETYADNAASSAASDALDDAKDYADGLDDALTQAAIFNRLTNNGTVQGLIMQDGQLYINASYISSGVLNANLLTAGIITDQTGNNYWNLTTGEFALTGVATETYATNAASSALSDAEDYTDSAITAYDDTLTQSEIFNRLTNNGANNGIYMLSGHLYINASYIVSGVLQGDIITAGCITDQTGNNYWDLDTGDFNMTGVATETYATNAASSAAASALSDAKDYADGLDDDLDQEEIFNRLTNNGAAEGLIMSNGNLYINASYINSGTLAAARVVAGYLTAGTVGGWSISDSLITKMTELEVDGTTYTYQIGIQAVDDSSALTKNFLFVRRRTSENDAWEFVFRVRQTGLMTAPMSMQSGEATITPSAANTPTSVTVTFDTPMLASPRIMVTPKSSVPGTAVLGVGVTDVSSTGFTLWLTRTNTTDTTVSWFACCG